MNFKLFTSALMATAATAQSAGQDNSLGDALHQNFQEMPAHVQRRFWVRIQLYNASRKMSINKLFSINWLQTLLMQLSTITSVKSITYSGLLEVGAQTKTAKSFVILCFSEIQNQLLIKLYILENKVEESFVNQFFDVVLIQFPQYSKNFEFC